MTGNREIGKIIRTARVERNLTLEDVGKLVGVSAATVGRWEHGEMTPGGEKLIVLAEQLGFVSKLFPGYKKCACDTEIVDTPQQIAYDMLKKRIEIIEEKVLDAFREKEKRLLSTEYKCEKKDEILISMRQAKEISGGKMKGKKASDLLEEIE